MRTRNVVVTDRQDEVIRRLVGSGRYQNASEVLRDALRLLEQQAAEDAARLKALRAAARLGQADIAAGRYRSFASGAALRRRLEGVAARALRRRRK